MGKGLCVGINLAENGDWMNSREARMADVVYSPVRLDENQIVFRVLKNRTGNTGSVVLPDVKSFWDMFSIDPPRKFEYPKLSFVNKSKKHCQPKVFALV